MLELTVPNWRRNFRRAVRRYNKGQPVDDRYRELIDAIYGPEPEPEWEEVTISIHMQGTDGGARDHPWDLDYEVTVRGSVPYGLSDNEILRIFGPDLEARAESALVAMDVFFIDAVPVFTLGLERHGPSDHFSDLRGEAVLGTKSGTYARDVDI